MSNDFVPPASNDNGSIIDEHGFTAILREAVEPDCMGIIGAPRINPTQSGLWIEDSFAAAIDTIMLAMLEDFAKNENRHKNVDLISGAGPLSIIEEIGVIAA
jgi:hypothetical protein